VSILVDENTRLLVQGITGGEGSQHARRSIAYGTNVVAGMTPGRGGQRFEENVPVFNTVREAVAETGANVSIIYVPAPFAADAILEAADAGLPLVVCITEGIPVLDMVMVRRALALLAPQAGERIADMFCGLGNFTLAIARSGAQVTGFEGARGLVERGQYNAARNGLSANAEFRLSDLFKIDQAGFAQLGRYDRMLIDPPRDGAVELIKSFHDDAPRRIVYVSCSPATLARDAGVLVQTKGYALSAAGVINMFPHTSHVESIAVFDRQ